MKIVTAANAQLVSSESDRYPQDGRPVQRRVAEASDLAIWVFPAPAELMTDLNGGALFRLVDTEYDREGDVTAWQYVQQTEDVRTVLTVFND